MNILYFNLRTLYFPSFRDLHSNHRSVSQAAPKPGRNPGKKAAGKMISGGGANLKKSSNAKKALVNGLFSNAGKEKSVELEETVRPMTLHDTVGATPQNILSLLDEDTREEYSMIFRALDDDDSGEITVKEMADAFRTMGLELSNEEIRNLVLSVDQDSNGLIDIGEFSLMLYKLSTGTASQSHLRTIMKRRRIQLSYCERAYPRLNFHRKRLWRLMDEPSSSTAAQIVSITIMSLIIISCLAFVIETDPFFHRRNESFWFGLEAFCTLCFTLEYVLRIASQQNLSKFISSFMNTVDLVAILPFYVELALADAASSNGFDSQSLRAIRLVRVFRLFKIGRHVSWLNVFGETYVASLPPLIMIVFIIGIVMVFLASLVHTFEAKSFDAESQQWLGPDGVPSTVASIPDGFWFSVVTMTTVGYGDITPKTALGRIVGMVGSIVGIMVLAVPISVISLNFHEKYDAQERRSEQKHASKLRIEKLEKAVAKDRQQKLHESKLLKDQMGKDVEAAGALKAEFDEKRKNMEEEDFRTVVSLMHAAAERAVFNMNMDTMNVLATEEHNRVDMKHEIKSMMEQWEPHARVELIRRSQSFR